MSAASAYPNLKPFKPGQCGNPAGRRKRVFPHVDALLKAEGKEPVKELLALLPKLSARYQARIWLDLLPYVHLKIHPGSYVSDTDGLEGLSTEELKKLVREQWKEVG